MTNESIGEIAERLVETYNRLHGVEATARIIDARDDLITVEFTGTFCHTCGIRDWVEDYAYLAVSMGYDLKLVEYIEPKDETEREFKRIGVFKYYGRLNSDDRVLHRD